MGRTVNRAQFRHHMTALHNALLYIVKVREIKCLHAYPDPDLASCARCIADKALSEAEPFIRRNREFHGNKGPQLARIERNRVGPYPDKGGIG